jgi:hypothetical protein
MGNGTTSLGSDKPSPGVVTLEPINFVIDSKLTGRPELPMEEVEAPSPGLLKKLTAVVKSLGVDIASNLDAKGNLKPDQVEGAKKRVTEQLEEQKKKTGLPPEDKKAFTAVLPYLKNETEFPLLSQGDQAQILKDAGFKDTDEALKALNKEYASPDKKVAHFIKLKAREAEAEKKPVWTAARLYDTAAALDPDNSDLRLDAARAKRVWAEAETDPESKKTLLQESVVHLHAVLKKDPENLEALNQLKQTLSSAGTPEAAQDLAGTDLPKLLRKKDASPEILKARTEILGVLGQDKEDKQKTFDAGLEKAEALAQKDPEAAKEILSGLEKDLGQIEKFTQSGTEKNKLLDWNRLRRFYKATGNTEKLPEVEKEIRAGCDKLRGTLKVEKGASPTADQLETAQFLADFSAHRQSYEELTTDIQTWKQLVTAAPPEVLGNSAKLDQLLGIYKDMTYLKDEAVKIPRPLGRPVGEVEPGYENATHNSKGDLILRYEAQSEEEKVRSDMGLIQGDINRLVEQMERDRTGIKEGGLPMESYQRMSAVSDLLVTLQYSQPKEENVAREFLSLKGLDIWVEKKGGADQFLSKTGEIQDPQQKRAALFHALHAYTDLKDEGKMRETIEQIQKTLPFMPKGPEQLAERLQVEQVIQTAVKGVSPELEEKFKKSCAADALVLQGMVDEGSWLDGSRSVALKADEKFRAIKAISGNTFVDAEDSLDENGFFKKEKVDDVKQTLHAKLDAFKKTKDYVSALDRVEDEGAKNWKPTFASTQKLWTYLNDQPEYTLLSLEDRKAFLKEEGYEVFEGYKPRVGDVAKSVVNDISPFKVFDSQDLSRIDIDAVRPTESVSARLAVFTDRQASRLEDKGLPEEAARTYKAAMEKNPDDPQARLGYARNLLEWEKVSQKIHPDPKRLQAVREEAAQQVKAVLDKNPKNWDAKGLGLEITLDQKYENDPEGKLKFLREEFDKSITLYEGLAAKDKTEGAACLNYLRTIAGRFHSNFENPGNLDELKDLARAYRLFKAIPHKSEEDKNIFQHYVELLDRNMGALKSGTLKYEGVDPLTLAQTVVEIDTKVRKMPGFEIAKDLESWQKALDETPRDVVSPKDRVDQYGSMMKEWMRLRDRVISEDPTVHLDFQKITDENIRPLADKIRDEVASGSADPGAYDRMNSFFDRLIDTNDLSLLGSLSADGLTAFIEKSNQLDQTFDKAKSLSGSKQRTALLGVIDQARAVRNEEVAQEAVKLYEESLGGVTPPEERLKATLDLNQALKGSKFAVAEEVEGKATSLVQDTWKDLESKNSADASTVRQLLLVADFMGKERFGEGPKIAAKAKEKIKMIRAVLVQTLDGKGEANFRPQTDEQRKVFTEALKSAPSLTDTKDRVQAANLVVDIDRALFNESLNEAGDDAEKKNALSTRMLADFKRWQTSVGSVEDYTLDEKSEQMNLLMLSAFSLEKLGTDPGALFKDPAYKDGIKEQVDSLQKEMKDLAGSQARVAFDKAVPPGSLPDTDRDELWKSFEKDFSPLFDKAWEGRNKPGQENLAMLQVKSFTTQESLGEIVRGWKEADQAVKNCQPPKSEEDLKSLQKAALTFGGLGMTDRAKEAMKPLVALAHAPGIKISDQVPLLNGIAQLYQQAGLTDEANAALQEIIGISETHDPTPDIPDLKQIGVLAKAFQYLNKNDVEKAEDVLATLPDNPTAKAVLEGIRDGRKKCRDMQMIGMLRAYYDNYEANKNEEDGIIIKTLTDGTWEQKFDAAGKEDLRINRSRLDQIEQWMQVDGYDFQRAVQMAFIDDPNAYHEFNICLERFSADLNIAVNNLPRTLVTRTKGPDQVSFAWLSNPTLSDADFGTAVYRFGESLKNQGMFSAASQIAQVASENKFISARARELLMQGIPDAQKKEAFTKALVMSTTGMSILGAKTWGDVAWETVMFVGPMAAGNALGSLGKSMYAARAVGVASKVEGLLLKVGVGAEEAAVWSSRASKFGAWTAKSGFEALGFTGFEMGAERLRTGKLIYADDFMKKWSGMLVTFGLCHVTGGLASTEKKVVVEGIEVSVQRSPITRWLAGVGSFLAADMVNESIGLKEKTPEHWSLKLVNAVKSDLSMRVAGEVVNKSTGGYFHQVEMRAEERMNENQYLRVADHMGLETTRDGKGELNENTARVIQETMALAEAKGIDPRNVEEVIKFQNELMENLPREEIDRVVQALDPTGENASALRAALFSYVNSETGGAAAPEAEGKTPGKVEGLSTKAAQEKSAVSARELLDEIPAKMQPIAVLKIPVALKATVMEQALVKKMGEVEVKALAEQMGEIHEAYTALVDKLGYKAAHLLIRQAIRGVNKIENLSEHLEALTGQLEQTEKSLKQGLKGKEALSETEIQEAIEKLFSAALEISQAADDPKVLEKALEALTQDFIEERKNDQKVKKALEEASQKAKVRAQRVQPREGAGEDRGSKERKGEQEDLSLEGVGPKNKGGYRLPTSLPPPLFLEIKNARGMADYRANVESFDRGSTVRVVLDKNGRPEVRITRLTHPQEHVRTEWKSPNEIKNIEFREISVREDVRPADETAVRSYLWWGRSFVEANRNQVSKTSAAEIQNLNREFDNGTSIHATLEKDGTVRLEKVKVNEKGEIASNPADMAAFKAYVDYVEKKAGPDEATIDELTRPFADALTVDSLTQEERTHQKLSEDDFLTEEVTTRENEKPVPLVKKKGPREEPIPLVQKKGENPFAMAAKGKGSLAPEKAVMGTKPVSRDEPTAATRIEAKKTAPSPRARSVDGESSKDVWANVSDGVRNELKEKVRQEAGKSITQNEADRVIQLMDRGPDSFNLVHEALSRGQLAELARDPLAFRRQIKVDFEVNEALGQVSDIYSFIDQTRRKHGLGDPTSPVEVLKAEMTPSGKEAGIEFTVRSAEDGKVLLDHIASHAQNVGLQAMPLEVVERGQDFVRLKTPKGGEFTVRVEVENTGSEAAPKAVTPVEKGEKPQFLGLRVTPQFEQGFQLFIGKESANPFVDFSVEGAKVFLNERNYGRAERKEGVEGFAKDDGGKAGFDHIVDRHAHDSAKRGETPAGIYAENVDIELMGRETVKSWDRTSLSYDEEGRLIFIFQKDFTQTVGKTTRGKETKTNQVILSSDGKIISSFPVEVGTKGWVGKGDLNAKGTNFAEIFLQKSASAEVEKRHEPFLPGNPDALKTNLYLADVPYGVINQRTRANFNDELPSTNANAPGTRQEEITILKKGKPVKVMATVAEMRFEQPIGIREEMGPDGKVTQVPLYCNRTYFIDGNIVSGYPIKEFGEKPVDQGIWNPSLRSTPVVKEKEAAAMKGHQPGPAVPLEKPSNKKAPVVFRVGNGEAPALIVPSLRETPTWKVKGVSKDGKTLVLENTQDPSNRTKVLSPVERPFKVGDGVEVAGMGGGGSIKGGPPSMTAFSKGGGGRNPVELIPPTFERAKLGLPQQLVTPDFIGQVKGLAEVSKEGVDVVMVLKDPSGKRPPTEAVISVTLDQARRFEILKEDGEANVGRILGIKGEVESPEALVPELPPQKPKAEPQPLAAAAFKGPEVKVEIDLSQPLPSQVLGDQVIAEVKKEIVRDPNLNRKGQVRLEDVHEITCDQADLNQKMDEVAAQMIETGAVAPPKDLYFITNVRRAGGIQIIGLYRYEIPETGNPTTHITNSLFTFTYRIIEGPKGEPLFKIDWIKAGDVEEAERSLDVAKEKVQYWKEDPEVQGRPDREERLKKAELNVVKAEAHLKAQEDFRKKVSNTMMGEVVQFVAKFPGATVQTRGDNLITAMWAGSKIPQAHFIEITDPKKYDVARRLDPKFIDALEKIHVLTGEQAKELHKMLNEPVSQGWEKMQNINIHNQFIRFVRENYSKNPAGARNEVEFVFKPLLKSGEMRTLVNERKDGHNRGDLWIEGQVPKKAESPPEPLPAVSLQGAQSGESRDPFQALTKPGSEILVSRGRDGQLVFGDSPEGEGLFKLRRGPRGYYLQPMNGVGNLEIKQGESLNRVIGPGQTQSLSSGDLEVNVGKDQFRLKVP